jgi:signal transduction histidine kinase
MRAIALYRDDRNALVAERMLLESQKADTIAVLKSLRSSMSRKVDDNLLEVIQNSKEYFDEKGKSLEDNWELMAIRLRQAAMKSIRPFSHRLHRRGAEKMYKVRFREIAEYTVYSSNPQISWVLFIFAISTHRFSIQDNSNFVNELTLLTLKVVVLAFGLYVIQFIRSRNHLRTIYGYFLSMALFSLYFIFLSQKIHNSFNMRQDTLVTYFVSTAWILVLVFTFGFVGAFAKGQHAEIDFLERAISTAQLEQMILAREEARISRELAKYLHGTIQSRLMASAIGLEKARRRGDKKMLEKELAQAYENLRVPSASYFSAPENTLKEEIKKVVGKWNDLMKITVKFPRSIPEIQPDILQEIGNVVNEGLSNSFRHGNATAVKVEFKTVESQLQITLIDDGSGPTSGKPGLGTEWFRAISGNSWNLRAVDTGSGSILELFILLK